MSEKANQYVKIQEKQDELFYYKEKILKQYGWKQRCDFPDAIWRWCKEVKGGQITLPMEQALKIEFLHSGKW